MLIKWHWSNYKILYKIYYIKTLLMIQSDSTVYINICLYQHINICLFQNFIWINTIRWTAINIFLYQSKHLLQVILISKIVYFVVNQFLSKCLIIKFYYAINDLCGRQIFYIYINNKKNCKE